MTDLAVEHHVIGFQHSFKQVDGQPEPTFEAKKISTKRASIFRGFCSYHDSALFKPLDSGIFNAGDDQLGALYLRCIAIELHRKAGSLSIQSHFRELDAGLSEAHQRNHQKLIGGYVDGSEVAKTELDELFESIIAEFSKTGSLARPEKAIWISFDGQLPFQTAGACTPIFSPNGDQLQDLGNLSINADHIAFAVFSDGEKSHAVLMSHEASRVFDKFSNHIAGLPNGSVADFLLNFALVQQENTFFSPSFWEQIGSEGQENCTALMREVVEMSPPDYTSLSIIPETGCTIRTRHRDKW